MMNNLKAPFDFTGKTIIVTGGASGIGLAISQVFAEQGGLVYILDINQQQATDAAESILAKGFKAKAVKVDVSDHQDVLAVMADINTKNSIDVLINNAGVAHVGNAVTTQEADLVRLFNINVKSVYSCIHAAIPFMQKRGGGVILNMASIASSVGLSDRLAYSMSKGAVRAMTMSVAKDFLGDNIRCNCISPARVHTPFVDGFIQKNYPDNQEEMFAKLSASQPIGRMGKPVEIAWLALYLCSEQAGFVTGCDYPIDGGFIYLNS